MIVKGGLSAGVVRLGRPAEGAFTSFKAGGIPSVLRDGNTVAWFDYLDSRTVNKDAQNRVNYWLDKMHYAVGANIMPNPLNFMDDSWTVYKYAAKDNNSKFYSITSRGGIRNSNYQWTLGATYWLRAKVKITSGKELSIEDYNAANAYFQITGTNGWQEIDNHFTVTAIGTNGILLYLSSSNIIAEFEYLYIKPVAGNHIRQATAASQPVWDATNGILFDGVDDFMNNAVTWSLPQPVTIYLVGKQVTWSDGKIITEGSTNYYCRLWQQESSPQIRISASANGANYLANTNLAVNTFGIVTALFNGSNSLLQVNNTDAVTGDIGTNAMNGLYIGKGASAAYSNIQVKAIIIRKVADSADIRTVIKNYLNSVYEIW